MVSHTWSQVLVLYQQPTFITEGIPGRPVFPASVDLAIIGIINPTDFLMGCMDSWNPIYSSSDPFHKLVGSFTLTCPDDRDLRSAWFLGIDNLISLQRRAVRDEIVEHGIVKNLALHTWGMCLEHKFFMVCSFFLIGHGEVVSYTLFCLAKTVASQMLYT